MMGMEMVSWASEKLAWLTSSIKAGLSRWPPLEQFSMTMPGISSRIFWKNRWEAATFRWEAVPQAVAAVHAQAHGLVVVHLDVAKTPGLQLADDLFGEVIHHPGPPCPRSAGRPR